MAIAPWPGVQRHDCGAEVEAPAPARAAPATSRAAPPPVRAAPAPLRAEPASPRAAPASPRAAPAAPPDAWVVERLAVRLRTGSRLLAPRIARTVQRLVAHETWTFHGYAGLSDYAAAMHQRSASWFRGWAKLAAALDQYPALEAALMGRDGRPIGSVVATAIAAVATADTIPSWIDRARRRSAREVLEQVRDCRSRGETAPPPDPGTPGDAATGDTAAAPAAESDHTWGKSATRTTLEDDDPNIEARVQVGFHAPRKVAYVFDDILDLHRAVTGSQATVQSFVEALAAEAAAGLAPPDCVQTPLQPRDHIARVEHALARINQRWDRLQASDAASTSNGDGDADGAANDGNGHGNAGGAPDGRATGTEPRPLGESGGRGSNAPPAPSAPTHPFPVWDSAAAVKAITEDTRALAAAVNALLAFLADDPGTRQFASAVEKAHALHEELHQLLAVEDAIERVIGRVLHLMSRRGDWTSLGFATLGHYAVERLGMPRRTAESRAGILRALRGLADVCTAYESGAIGLEAAWALHRILAPHRPDAEIQRLWIEYAKTVEVKTLRQECLAQRRQGLTTPEPPSLRPRAQPAPCPMPSTDAEFAASLKRTPGDSRGRLRGLQLPAVDDPCATLADLARTDIFMRFRLPLEIADSFQSALEAERQHLTRLAGAILAADAVASAGAATADEPLRPHVPVSLRAAMAFVERQRRVPTWVALLALLEDYAETHDDPQGFPERRWDRVYCRDGWRCRAPGCTARVGIEDHHLRYRSRNGSNELYNQICLCAFHHRQGEHGEFMRCWGTAPDHIHWSMGALEIAVRYFNERRIGPMSA